MNNSFYRKDLTSSEAKFSAKMESIKILLEGQIERLETLIESNDNRYKERYIAQQEAIKEAFSTSQTAINKSENNQEKRNDAVYVTIAELQRNLATVIARAEFDLNTKNLQEKITVNDKKINDIQLDQTKYVTVAIYDARHAELQTQITTLQNLQTANAGKGIGLNQGWLYLLSGIGLISTIMGIILAISGHVR